MSTDTKDTIYVDVDDEITGIVNKITSSKKSIIALVLPKRASSLQSIVNMKLLKRSAEQNDKKLVLITSESKLLPLAGAAGLYVASNLNTKPYIPTSPMIGGQTLAQETNPIDPNTPVSTLAPKAKYADDEAIEIDNTPKPLDPAVSASKKPKDSPKDKKKKVPNFSSFRKKAIIIAVVLLLVVSTLIWAFAFAPKAKLTFKAETSDVPVNITFTADESVSEVNVDNKIVRASVKELSKNDSEKVVASGEKNNGNKASGTVTLKNCKQVDGPVTISAGTGVSSGEFTFVTQKAITLDPSFFSGGGACLSSTKDVSVIAQKPGDEYNLSSREYTVAGNSDVEAQGSSMSGGTNKIVKVVSKADINKAKERLNSKQNTSEDDIKKELIAEGYIPVEDTFETKEGAYNASPAVDTEASEVTVSITNEYSMLGVKKEDVQELIKMQVNEDQKDKSQAILNDGIDSAVIKPSLSTASVGEGQKLLTVETTAVVGPDINEDEIKEQITGKKKGEAEELLKKRTGISDPTIELSPFWVGKVPKTSKITIEVQKADGAEL